MTRVLVTGGTGLIGRTLCPALRAAGHEVCASSRNPRAAAAMNGVEVRPVSDLGPDTDWSAAVDGVEAVVHLAARVHVTDDRSADPLSEYRRVNTDGTARLARAAAAAGVRRLVFLSTIKVNGEATGEAPFSESDPVAPGDVYAVSKWEAETALFGIAAQGPMEAVVLRPPLVYGQRVGGNFLALLKICRLAPPLPLGGVSNRRSLIYTGNLSDAIHTVPHPRRRGGPDIPGSRRRRCLDARADPSRRRRPGPPGAAVSRAGAAVAGGRPGDGKIGDRRPPA